MYILPRDCEGFFFLYFKMKCVLLTCFLIHPHTSIIIITPQLTCFLLFFNRVWERGGEKQSERKAFRILWSLKWANVRTLFLILILHIGTWFYQNHWEETQNYVKSYTAILLQLSDLFHNYFNIRFTFVFLKFINSSLSLIHRETWSLHYTYNCSCFSRKIIFEAYYKAVIYCLSSDLAGLEPAPTHQIKSV